MSDCPLGRENKANIENLRGRDECITTELQNCKDEIKVLGGNVVELDKKLDKKTDAIKWMLIIAIILGVVNLSGDWMSYIASVVRLGG